MSADWTLLTGPRAPDLLAAAVGQYGGRIGAVEAVNVGVAPSGDTLAQYRAEVIRADGSRGRELLVAATGDRIPPGALVLAGDLDGADVRVGMWRWPQDPSLPGLAHVAHPRTAARLLAAHGLADTAEVAVSVRAYRPGRRAVIELRAGDRRWFVKVVTPAATDDLRARHDMLVAHGLPVPPVLAASGDGAVVLAAAAGRQLRELVVADDEPPSPATLDALLDDLPASLLSLPARRGPWQRVSDSAAVLGHTVGADPAMAAAVARIAAELSDQPPTSPPVPVHGDFYEAQLFAERGRVTGLLDVDTAGPGDRADDWATFIGHLVVAGAVGEPVRRYCRQASEYAHRRFGAATVRRRVTAVLLGLATAPFRQQRRNWPELTASRLALAEQWRETR